MVHSLEINAAGCFWEYRYLGNRLLIAAALNNLWHCKCNAIRLWAECLGFVPL